MAVIPAFNKILLRFKRIKILAEQKAGAIAC